MIPPALVVARYFAGEQRALDDLKADQERLAGLVEEMKEEYGGEEGLLAEALDDRGNLSRSSVTARLKMIRSASEAETDEERRLLGDYLALLDKEAEAGRRVKEAQKMLDEMVINQYGRLTEAEVKALVVDDKWLTALNAEVASEMESVSHALTGRIKELTERYIAPLPQIVQEVYSLSVKVDAHLKKIGAVWN